MIMKMSHSEDWIDLICEPQRVMSARRITFDVVNTSVAAVIDLLRWMSTSGKEQLEFTADKRERNNLMATRLNHSKLSFSRGTPINVYLKVQHCLIIPQNERQGTLT